MAVFVVGASSVGCAAQHDESLRLSDELARARAEAVTEQARAAALESRIARLEQRAPATPARPETAELSSRLDRLIELNERLLAERTALPAERTAPPASRSASGDAAATKLTDEQRLRALVERMRGRPGRPHGGLSREQEAALRVLIQPERKLDTDDLLPVFY